MGEQTAVAFLAGYTVDGGAFKNPRGSLNVKGLIDYRGGRVALTAEQLHQRVLDRLPGPEQKLLRVLLDDGKEDLGMVDRSLPVGVYNAFEAALIYKPDAGASTFYFPIGFDARFTNKDDVISVMKRAVWVRHGTNVVVAAIDPEYTRAANVDID